MNVRPLIRTMSGSGGLKKPWRDAACLILVTGPFRYSKPPLPKEVARVAGVRFGSTPPVILENVEDGGALGGEGDVDLLFVQRGNNEKAKWANNYVFPGGVIDAADSSPKWMDIFRENLPPYKDPFASFLELAKTGQHTLPLYEEVSNTPIPGEVAFRICAIREAFEEAGVLLARDQAELSSIIDFLPGSFRPSVKELSEGVREEWRQRVHKNAEDFLTMCRELKFVPDIWSLIEWSNWLTPRNFGRRYDTVFYVVCSEEREWEIRPDGKEVIHTMWMGPGEAVQRFLSGELQLAAPQFGEIRTLERYLKPLGEAPCLHSYALRESLLGNIGRKTPVCVLTKDNVVMSITNTDDLYPLEHTTIPPPPDLVHHPQSTTLRDTHHIQLHTSLEVMAEYTCPTHTAEELRTLSDRVSGMEFRGLNNFIFYDNVVTSRIEKHCKEYANSQPLHSKL